MRSLRGLLIAIALIVSLVLFWTLFYFGILNTQWVILHIPTIQLQIENPFPTSQYEVQLWLVILMAFFCGVVLTLLLLVLPTWIRRGVERRRERRFIENLEGELADLRNLPVSNPAPLEDVQEEPTHDQGSAGFSGAPATGAADEEQALLAASFQDLDKRRAP